MSTIEKMSGLDVAIRTADVAELWSRDQVNLLLAEYAAKGTTTNEFTAFLIIAKNLGLDPFTHEIWLPDFDGSGQNRAPYVGRDGLLSVAERSGQFDGLVSGVVYDEDEFDQGIDKPTHVIAKGDRGRIRFGYAYVYRKDRRYPFRVIAERADFLDPKLFDAQGNLRTGGVTKTPWFRFPSLMLKKVAEANALRLAFKVSGVVAVADNSTPISDGDQGDVVESTAVEVEDVPGGLGTDSHAREDDPAPSGPAETATAVASGSGRPGPTQIDMIGVAPLDGGVASGEQVTELCQVAKPMKRADLLRVVKWATRRDEWPTMALAEIHRTRCAELIAFFKAADQPALARLVGAVEAWEASSSSEGQEQPRGTPGPGAAAAPDQPDPGDGKLL